MVRAHSVIKCYEHHHQCRTVAQEQSDVNQDDTYLMETSESHDEGIELDVDAVEVVPTELRYQYIQQIEIWLFSQLAQCQVYLYTKYLATI